MDDKKRHGSQTFYELLEGASKLHEKKSHDYASNEDPYGNYHFAGRMAMLFSHSPEDAGFVGRMAEKIYRIANLESSGKTPSNESISDTEQDLIVITCLWIASRIDRRTERKRNIDKIRAQMREGSWEGLPEYK